MQQYTQTKKSKRNKNKKKNATINPIQDGPFWVCSQKRNGPKGHPT